MRFINPQVLEQLPQMHIERDLSDNQRELIARAKLLEPDDRMIVELTIAGRLSRRRIAELLDTDPGSVSRRFYRLVKRLNDPICSALARPRSGLREEYRQLAIGHFIQGHSAEQLATRHQLPGTHVRRVISFVNGWFAGFRGGLETREALLAIK
jgi:DNA-directed RNA polymerase specialized sigma24 family protein